MTFLITRDVLKKMAHDSRKNMVLTGIALLLKIWVLRGMIKFILIIFD